MKNSSWTLHHQIWWTSPVPNSDERCLGWGRIKKYCHKQWQGRAAGWVKEKLPSLMDTWSSFHGATPHVIVSQGQLLYLQWPQLVKSYLLTDICNRWNKQLPLRSAHPPRLLHGQSPFVLGSLWECLDLLLVYYQDAQRSGLHYFLWGTAIEMPI